tara:strand:- start:285 stop:404 length:120 start_codon:yes stop_codon:yes gene_type:complete
MNVPTSGGYGKNYGTQIKIAKKQKMQEKYGAGVSMNMEK